jgi:hypothetical protein
MATDYIRLAHEVDNAGYYSHSLTLNMVNGFLYASQDAKGAFIIQWTLCEKSSAPRNRKLYSCLLKIRTMDLLRPSCIIRMYHVYMPLRFINK